MKNAYQLIYKKKDENNFWKLFELLKLDYKYLGARYNPKVIEYYFLRALDSNYQVDDCSFVLTLNGEPFSGFLGAIFSKDKFIELSLFEIPCLAIDSLNLSNNKKKQINIYFNELISRNFCSFKVKGPDYYSNLPIICENLLKLSSNLDNNITRTIDLNKKESELKHGIRKSYHSLINWGMRELKIEIYDEKNITWEIMNAFRELHIQESQRETRSIGTWQKQYEAIQSGAAFCIIAKLNDDLVSAAFFIFSNKTCYYFSSASKRVLFDKPLNHSIIWMAILESKKKGALLFDIGVTHINQLNNTFSKKEKNISYFKDGFGGNQTLNPFVEYKK